MTKVLNPSPRVFHPVVTVALGAMAGGMGWGIRGQYGHETGAMIAGIRLLNSPFDPSHRLLPSIYFSDDWRWEPDADLKPRPEVWGGLLVALAALTAYVSLVRRDPLVRNLTLTAFVAGAIGFPAGQCLQAFHAWNPEWFADDRIAQLDRHINWWNMMEITFGTIAGGGLAFGTWWNRRLIVDDAATQRAFMKAAWELLLVVPHVTLLVAAGFADVPALEFYLQFGFVMSLLPVIGITGGRWWPWLFALPIVAVPIAAKTLNELAYKTEDVSRPVGWIMFVLIPIGVALFTAVWLTRIGADNRKPIPFAATALLISSWLYFWLNFAFFRHPWPWNTWTSRTPSALIVTVCIASLTAAALYGWRTAASPRVESRMVA